MDLVEVSPGMESEGEAVKKIRLFKGKAPERDQSSEPAPPLTHIFMAPHGADWRSGSLYDSHPGARY